MFLHSFGEQLQLNPSQEDGPRGLPGLDCVELAQAMLHGDAAAAHRVHCVLLTFLARASLTHASLDEDDTDGVGGECVQLESELAREGAPRERSNSRASDPRAPSHGPPRGPEH